MGQLQTEGTFWKAKGFGGGSLQRRAGVCYPTPTSHPQPRQMEGCSAHGLWEHPTRAKSGTLTLELKQGRSWAPQRVGAGGLGPSLSGGKGNVPAPGVDRQPLGRPHRLQVHHAMLT